MSMLVILQNGWPMTKAPAEHWTIDDAKEAVAGYRGTQYYQPLPDSLQFVHSVAKIIAQRAVKDKSGLCSAPALFLLGPVPDSLAGLLKREATFSRGGVEVAGKVWFGSEAMNCSNGIAIPEGADSDAVFQFAEYQLQAGGLPACYFDGSESEETVRFYPDGIAKPDVCMDCPITGAHITEETLRKALNDIHAVQMLTPTASLQASRLWEDSSKSWAAKSAEGEAQIILQLALAPRLGSVRVQVERTGKFGRFDLALVEQDPRSGRSLNHAVIELKVIKSLNSAGNKVAAAANQHAVIKGLKQAFSYREQEAAKMAVLCCYDMRTKPDLPATLLKGCQLAADLSVHFWAWPLFPSPDHARDWAVANHLKAKRQAKKGGGAPGSA